MTDQILTDQVYNLLNSVYNLLDLVEDGNPTRTTLIAHVNEVESFLGKIQYHLSETREEMIARMIDDIIEENRDLLQKLAKM